MKVIVFLNSLSLGGTEKAACAWAHCLARRSAVRLDDRCSGFNEAKSESPNSPRTISFSQIQDRKFQIRSVAAVSLTDGPRRSDLTNAAIPLHVPSDSKTLPPNELAEAISDASVIHAHAPGFPHSGDILGSALKLLPKKIAVVQTNIFGKLQNPAEDAWTDFRLFVSWTSCVQAARRAGRKLDLDFFRRQSVAVYPVEAISAVESEKWKAESERQRATLDLQSANVLFGRFSRPEPNKWTPLVLEAFFAAHRQNPNIRLLLREPPAAVATDLITTRLATWSHNIQPSAFRFPVFLFPATADPHELTVSQMACDVILHTSSIGESFGYGLAEPMALGKPVITNSVPWHDQAQIELVRHGECGLIASTVPSMEGAVLRMAEDSEWRRACGRFARRHIMSVADPEESTDRLEMAMRCAIEDRDNPLADQDLENAIRTAEYLDKHQWGHAFEESLWLRGTDAKIRFLRRQRRVRNCLKA